MIEYIILVAAWLLLMDAIASSLYRIPKLKDDGWKITDRRKIEYLGRALRFVVASSILLSLPTLTNGMLNIAGYVISVDAASAIALRLNTLETEISTRQELEFIARFARGIIALFFLLASL